MTFIDLNGIPNMYPFTEERTIYSRKIAGKPIVEHLLNGNEYWLKSSKKIAIKYPWHLLDVMKHILAAQDAFGDLKSRLVSRHQNRISGYLFHFSLKGRIR
jgi:hypothetical protein